MGSDGLLELDQDCWTAFAKYTLLLATLFGVAAVLARATLPGHEPVVQNSALAVPFGAVQTDAWLSA